MKFILPATLLLFAFLQPSFAAPIPEELQRELASCERLLQRNRSLPGTMTSRSLFKTAFIFLEAEVNRPDDIDFLMDTATRMQDRDENSRGFGNFRWKWKDGTVLDYNAVEFSMQYGLLLRLRHWGKLPSKTKQTLTEIFAYAKQGCLRHRVPESYTNIALMNAGNLILFGEILDDQLSLETGKERFENFCNYTWECGIHEYNSPTYTGVDIECLMLIHKFSRDKDVRQQAEALLKYFWTALAGNWFAPAGKLGGTRSRDYNFLRGLGLLDGYMVMANWLPQETSGVHPPLVALLSDWRPDPALREMNQTLYPRLVQQRYGSSSLDIRTNYVSHNIALSSSGSNYGPMDFPLCIDFAMENRNDLRGYFIPDARRDPYGKKKIPTGGGHDKTFHLRPFWIASQQRDNALGVALYHNSVYPPNPSSLESHFVFPANLDEIRIGETLVELHADKTFFRELKANESVFLRKGKAIAGIRVPWARNLEGNSAPVALVYDGNKHGAARITVGHHSFWGLQNASEIPGAAFWIRVGDNLSATDCDAWRREFATAPVRIQADNKGLDIQVGSQQSALSITTPAPYIACQDLTPPPHKYLLAINGKDYGRELLAQLPCIKKNQKKLEQVKILQLPPRGELEWGAETAVLFGGMKLGKDDEAFGQTFVWTPGAPGMRGGRSSAKMLWDLEIPEKTVYYLWSRVKTASQDDDSFFVSLTGENTEAIRKKDWHLGVHEQWEWQPLTGKGDPNPIPITLLAGKYRLEISCREDGAKLDHLIMTTNPNYQP